MNSPVENQWEQSSGPKTTEGKARAAHNADKGAVRPRLRKLAKVLKGQQEVRVSMAFKHEA